jgi:hypothetical protein
VQSSPGRFGRRRRRLSRRRAGRFARGRLRPG